MTFISPITAYIILFLYIVLNCIAFYKLFFTREVSLLYKIFWFFVILIFPFLGALVYLTVEKLYLMRKV